MGKASKIQVREGYTLVYRCENRETHRSYHARPPKERWAHLPNPWDDGVKDGIKYREVCGCISISQFNRWWPRGKNAVIGQRNSKYVILAVPNEYVRRGSLQVVFPREHGVIIGYLDHMLKKHFNEHAERYIVQT